jgi:hypothetical protein
MRMTALIILAIQLWTVCVVAGEPVITVRPRKADDRVTVHQEKGKTLVDIRSKRGIGAAALTLTKGKWPAGMTVYFHCRSLESFAVVDGKRRYTTSLGSKVTEIRLAGEKKSTLVKADDPRFIEVTRWKDRIQVALPVALFKDAGKTVKLEWVDAWR